MTLRQTSRPATQRSHSGAQPSPRTRPALSGPRDRAQNRPPDMTAWAKHLMTTLGFKIVPLRRPSGASIGPARIR